MKKSDSSPSGDTPEEELERLRKENERLKSKLKSQKEADKAKIRDLRKKLKKKNVPSVRLTEEQRRLLS
ncbi:hypothetical protein EVA_20826, partial [gut metagenome]